LPGGRCSTLGDLPEDLARVVDGCRRATLSTIGADGTIASVPVCFALTEGRVIVAIDDKPKGSKELARVRNIRRDPRVTLLFDRWDEDWTRLGWVMVKGAASLTMEADSSALQERYPQYRADPPGGPFIVVDPALVRWWSWE
jgi:PPOX class probable F420-dependent enzyme